MVDLGPPIPHIPGVSAELAAARAAALFGPCAHPEPVEVCDVTGELVAWLCPACDTQLPAEWQQPSPERQESHDV